MRTRLLTPFVLAAVASLVTPLPTSLIAQDAAKPARPAKILTVTERDRVQRVEIPIVVEPEQSAVLTLQEGGVLQELPVIEGSVVKEGDLIARVDTRILENNVMQARSQLEQAEQEFERAERLLQQDNISQSSYDSRKTSRDLAALSLEAAEKRLSDATLLAPFDGVVALVEVDQFQTVSNQQSIVTLQSEIAFKALANVPASRMVDSSDFQVISSNIVLDVAPLEAIPAAFRAIALQADPATQTYEAQFSFTRPAELSVLPGMTGELIAEVILDASKPYTPVIEIPTAAIQHDGATTYVWLVNESDMTVSRRNITVADEVGDKLAVTDGLREGDQIVGAGASYLFEGTKIRRFGN